MTLYFWIAGLIDLAILVIIVRTVLRHRVKGGQQ